MFGTVKAYKNGAIFWAILYVCARIYARVYCTL